MTPRQRTPLPSGLPKRFLDGQPGFQRLRKFLEIPNVKAVEAVFDAVKDAVPRVPGKPRGAERRRMAITAYYENPESRRELWRQALAPAPPAASRGQPLPSLEFIALQRHDAEFREREVDIARVEAALRDFPDVVDSVADAPDWQRPALAAWPALQHDIAEWDDLPDERREPTLLAVFAVATILDDLRLLQWAAHRAGAFADQFATLLNDQRDSQNEDEATRTAEEDTLRQWRETCEAAAAAARTLGADPLQPELFPEHMNELSRHVGILTDLREAVTEALAQAAPEKLLQRAHDIVAALAQGVDSPIARWTDQIAAQWRSAYPSYPPPVDFDVGLLQVDVDRLEAELPESLAVLRTATHRRADVQRRLDEARQRAEQEDDPLDLDEAQVQEAKLQQLLGSAAEEILRARDRVFQAVAPADQVFDPRRPFDEDRTTPEPREVPEPGPKPTAEATDADEADTDGSQTVGADEPETTEPDQDDTTEPDQDDATDGDQHDATSGDQHDTTEPDQDDTTDGNQHDTTEPGQDDTTQPDENAVRAPEPLLTASSDPPPLAHRRETPAAEGLWRALRAGRPGIAYHIARLCSEHGHAAVPPMLADLLAAAMLAPHVHSPDSEALRHIRPILERIDPTALLRDERRQPERDALSLLLFSATLRPALFAPTTGAPSLLRAVSLSDGLKPVYDIATRVAEHADRLLGVRIHASMFRSSQTGTWQQQFDALKARVRAWRAGADSKRNIYGRATKVWRDLFARDGLLAKLVRLVSDSDNSLRPDVEAIYREISDQKTFSQIVQRADRRGPKPNPIVGRALKQIWNDVQPAVEYSREWLHLMDTRPETAGFVRQQVDALRQEVERTAPGAIAALPDVGPASDSTSFAAALRSARRALDGLLQLFDGGDSAITESAIAPAIVLSRDLLYITDLKIDTDRNAVSTDVAELLDSLQNTEAHANDMRAAFAARLERDDLVGARLALDFIEGEEDLDACTASLGERIDDRRRALRAELQSTQKRLESAFCRGQLPADDRDGMAAKLTALRQAAQPSSQTPISLHDVKILTGSSERLLEVDNAIEAAGHNSIETVRRRLRNVPDDRMDEAAKAVVEHTIGQGYVQTAHEQINRLERGESVEPPPPEDPEDPFSAFTLALGTIETARETTDPQTILRGARSRDRVAAVPFDELKEEDAQSAAGLLDAWYQMARKRSLDTTRLRDLLRSLGFSVRVIPQRSGSQATVTTEPIDDRAVCPSRQFGSEANGRYRVLLNWDASATDSIFRSIRNESRDPTIVLHFRCLGAQREEIRKRATREHRLFLVVDESLVLFLAGRPLNRLSALFRCTLPYSAAQPYATTPSLVPQELFYGRRRERDTIMDQFGACFIYGGRQLGKTALLRQVEKDFGSDDRVAKWIDLKVNDIDRAPDLWRVIQHALRPSRVVRRDHEIDPESPRQVDSLLRQIREWLDGRDAARRLLLLLDEADRFLLVDAENDFRVSARLKGLMDETNRRFKVVFAGLHNVLRTTRHANHPLAHLGEPICVGAMTSNGEWKEAQALVREPLQAVGCRFGRDDLSTRILAHTNYYPSLIQLYGAELTRRLRDSDRAFPYAVDDDAIDDAYGSRELRDAIRERFLLTLQLDQRYEVICYALAHELREGADLDQGLTRDRILEAAQFWWSDGFQLRDPEFDMLLQELEGLGVLRAIEPDRCRYTLRNPNILLLLGKQTDFENALARERTPEPPYAPASFRARYPKDSHSARRGPLTRQQESKLHRGGVGVICGCPAAGLDDVQEFLSQRIGRDEFSRIPPAANAAEFERQLGKLRSVRNSVTVRLIPPNLQWDAAWVRAATRVVERKAQGKRLWNRVAFIATPDQLWRLLTDAAAAESDMDGVDWFPLGPCDLTFLQRWLDDINATADKSEAENFLRISGGWPVELDRFGAKRAGKRWQTRIDELRREVEKNAAKRLRDEFGLTAQAETVLRGLAGADDPFDDESIELVAGEIGVDPGLVRLRVDWGERLGLLSSAGDASWRFNSLVKRLIEATPGR